MRYLSADDVFTANTERKFYVKGNYNASMKKEIRSMKVGINKVNCNIIFIKCSCPAADGAHLVGVRGLIHQEVPECMNEERSTERRS